MTVKQAMTLAGFLFFSACSDNSDTALPAERPEGQKVKLIIGQDLGAVRGYTQSGHFPPPAGVTAYMGLYYLLEPERGFAGSGVDANGERLLTETDWGGGPANLLTMAEENPGSAIAIGLSMTESERENGLAEIIEGLHDDKIERLALILGKVDVPVYLRIAYEFDGVWNAGYGDTEKYKLVWRHIAKKLRRPKLDHVEFVWQASTSPVDDVLENGHVEDIRAWYPGDDVVDWMALSWFLHIDEQPTEAVKTAFGVERVLSQREQNDVLLAFAREKGKPVMIAELSAQGYDLEARTNANIGGAIDGPSAENRIDLSEEEIWRAWFAPMFEYVEANRDTIRAVAWINVDWDSQDLWDAPYEGGYWGDTRIEKTEYIRSKWQEEISKPWWQHGPAPE